MAETRKLLRTNEPGIYKRVRPDGKVTGYAVLFRAQGKQRKAYAPTAAAARAKRAELTTDIARGEYQPRSTVRLSAYLASWVETYRGTGKRGFCDGTREEYRRLIASFACRFFPERLRLVDVGPQHIAAFIAWLADPAKQDGKRLAPATIRNAVIPLRAAFRSARREGLVRTNQCDGLVIEHRDEIREDDDDAAKALSREQLAPLLQLAHGTHAALLIETIASTGLRISEAIALERRDLHLGGDAHLTVRRARVRRRVGPPKSGHGRRAVPLPQPLVHRLREHVADLPDHPDALVFPTPGGGYLDPDRLRSRTLKPLLGEIAAPPGAGWHTLRHSYASLQLAGGANIVALSRALGHHSPAFTLNVYAHLLAGDEVPALELGAVLAPAPSPEPSLVEVVAVHLPE